MKKLNFTIITVGLAIGLGFCLYFVRAFWIMLFTNTYVFSIHTNYFGEFLLEFVVFNLCVVFILTSFILLFKSYGEQYGE